VYTYKWNNVETSGSYTRTHTPNAATPNTDRHGDFRLDVEL